MSAKDRLEPALRSAAFLKDVLGGAFAKNERAIRIDVLSIALDDDRAALHDDDRVRALEVFRLLVGEGAIEKALERRAIDARIELRRRPRLRRPRHPARLLRERKERRRHPAPRREPSGTAATSAAR